MSNSQQAVVRLQRVIALATFALLGSTWPLWLPASEFPQIPWFAWACEIPAIVDRVVLLCLIASCLALLLTGPTRRWRAAGIWLFVSSLVLLQLPSQQRLQPWAYEFLLIALTLGLATPARALRILRWLVASIYIHSALSKVDVAFLGAQGELLLDGLLGALHLSDEFWSDRARQIAIGLFPAGELAIGIGLLIPRVRRWAVVGSYVMHLLLLLALGPWGLDHRPGVLIWNAYFVAQNWLLFRPTRSTGCEDVREDVNRTSPNEWLRIAVATSVIAAAVFCPFLQNRGWFDVWPSWAVYSSRPSQVVFTVTADRVADLPAGLQPFVGPPELLSDWRPVNLDAWSFGTLNCPIYPEERFRIAVIRTLVEDAGIQNDVRLIVHGPPDRWTGRRQTTEIMGSEQLREYSEHFRLNTLPRNH